MKIEDIKNLIKIFDNSKSTKFSMKLQDFELSLEKEDKKTSKTIEVVPVSEKINSVNASIPLSQVNLPSSQDQNNCENEDAFVTSPMVGTFYRKPSPEAAVFAEVGAKVKKGQVICIIEAMKIMNEIEAEFDCKIIEFMLEDAQPVEYGTQLVKVERI